MKIAVIVQRAGLDFTGGSESYAFTLASILSQSHPVDILTTTARDHMTWASELPEGAQALGPHLNLIRFATVSERGPFWADLAGKVEDMARSAASSRSFYRSLPLGLAESWVKAQGPDCPGLIAYLASHQNEYDRFIFLTYLYTTTYLGVDVIADKAKVFIVPTFHDENPAYLPVFSRYAALNMLFLTPEEQEVAENNIFGCKLSGSNLGFGLDDKSAQITGEAPESDKPYVLYAGRLEEAKGVGQLFDFFERYCAEQPGLILYTIGTGQMANQQSENIRYKGYLDEDEKLLYMKHAVCFTHPSPFESLSISLLESFMMGTPGLVNGHCAVLKGHIKRSGCGAFYEDYASFAEALTLLRGRAPGELAAEGRRYFETFYSKASFVRRINDAILTPQAGEAL